MYNFNKIEPEVETFWKENNIYQKAKEKGKNGKKFYFLDGPPYTSGRVHIGTAWNKVLKDMVLRYKRMRGFNVWDRAGYDMHGLPTEHATEKKLGLKNKDDIPGFGVAKFIKECEKLALANLEFMNKDFIKLGVWMDFENAYKSIDPLFIEGEWWLIKKAQENKRLYEGEKTMHWCANCATALAKHELEYKTVEEVSIFLKFKVVGKEKEYLIIWTTTPWTIPYNLGVMVSPELDYVRAKVDNEIWIVAKGLVGGLIGSVVDKPYEIIEEFNGEKLKGLKYIHPFENELKEEYDKLRKKSKKIHTVVLSKEYVNLSAGSGLVHMAPGCGPEDYEVGHREGIPPYNNLTESGEFPKGMGKFTGLIAKKDDKKFIEELRKVGALLETVNVEHEYAHCWRCKEPVIFRTTKQWFFKIEDLREKMKEFNKDIYWVPEWAGNRQFHSWLDNLRDNGITRQRYWGAPVPIWQCDKCNKYIVIGSLKELKDVFGKVPEDLHKPWIDELIVKCECGGTKKRIPDILDVWIDAGTTSWTCLDYPQKEDLFKKLYPADFILEGKDQIRGWFNLLFVASMIGIGKPSYKAVYMHGFVQDALGRKMSKSLGNIISPEEVIKEYGVDTFRYYVIGGANAGVDLNYNFEDMKLKFKNLDILWNIQNYLVNYSHDLNINPAKIKNITRGLEEEYILSKLNNAIKRSTEFCESYNIDQVPVIIEDLFLNLSRTYIQLTRDKLSIGTNEDKEAVLVTIYETSIGILKMLAIVTPHCSEAVYQILRKEFKLEKESVHLLDWPTYDESLINEKLELQFQIIDQAIQTILAEREKVQLGVRWPLREVTIISKDEKVKEAVKSLAEIMKTQTNIKVIKLTEEGEGIDFRGGKVYLNTNLDEDLEAEGYAREIMRRVQVLRKKAGLKKNDRIELVIKTDLNKLNLWVDEIKIKVGAKTLELVLKEPIKKYQTYKKENIKGKEIEILFNVLK